MRLQYCFLRDGGIYFPVGSPSIYATTGGPLLFLLDVLYHKVQHDAITTYAVP